MSEHPATVSEQRPGIHTAECPCGWMGGDWSDEGEAKEDARLHREGKRRPWTRDPTQPVKQWDPVHSRFY